VNATEATVRHEHHHITVPMFVHDGVDDGIDVRNVPGLLAPRLEVVDQLGGVETFLFRQRRPEHGRKDHLVGHAERAREVVLEDTTA